MNDHSVNLSVSVVIPTFNGRHLLEANLPAVIDAAPVSEVVVVDDASTDKTVEWLAEHYPNIKVVKHLKNLRFAMACNSGVNAARGEIVVLLNNDVKPQADFLPPLLEAFQDPSVFAVGCKERDFLSGQPQDQGRGCGAFKRGFMVHWRCEDQTKSTSLWAFGGSSAFRISMWQELGGMDPLFAPAYEEDRDICYRALKRGWQVRFAPLSVVEHQHETTNRQVLGDQAIQIASFKNQFLLVWKNMTDPSYRLQHILWLPYHLLVTTIRSKGAFLTGFAQALGQSPQVRQKRDAEKPYVKVSDKAIFRTLE